MHYIEPYGILQKPERMISLKESYIAPSVETVAVAAEKGIAYSARLENYITDDSYDRESYWD